LGAFSDLAQEKDAITSTIITRPFEKDQELYHKHTGYEFLDSRIGMMTSLPVISASLEVDLMNLIHSKTRNLIRKAQKSDIEFWHDSSIESLHFLAKLHHENMIAIGVPPKDMNFFDTLADVFTYDKDYRVYLARKDNKLIAALLVTYFNKTVSYFTPAVNVEYREFQPLNLLIFNAMIEAAQMDYQYWNWGGTAHSADGVYHFKKRWGSEECLYYYYTRSYKDLSKLTCLSSETLLNEYPFFYVIPFSELTAS
jgi:lipid II:glycine glycyltransferase (peptidoglycan interpeptide bridge formation enzyme)